MPNYRQEGKKSMVSFGVGHRPALDSRIAEMINEGSAKETKKMILICGILSVVSNSHGKFRHEIS